MRILERKFIWKNPGRHMGGKGLEGGRCTYQRFRDIIGRETCMLDLVFHCGGRVGRKFPLRYEMKAVVRGERERNRTCRYVKHNCFMFETFFLSKLNLI